MVLLHKPTTAGMTNMRNFMAKKLENVKVPARLRHPTSTKASTGKLLKSNASSSLSATSACDIPTSQSTTGVNGASDGSGTTNGSTTAPPSSKSRFFFSRNKRQTPVTDDESDVHPEDDYEADDDSQDALDDGEIELEEEILLCQSDYGLSECSGGDHDSSRNFAQECLTILVLGATGELAKRKTFPALFQLYVCGCLPESFAIIGFAPHDLQEKDFRSQIKPFLTEHQQQEGVDDEDDEVSGTLSLQKKRFLAKCLYRQGKYDSVEDIEEVSADMLEFEEQSGMEKCNRLLYFAISSDFLVNVGKTLRTFAFSSQGWNKIVLEKPFGSDLRSFHTKTLKMHNLFDERQIYRIDQRFSNDLMYNVMFLRFANILVAPLWHSDHIDHVTITCYDQNGVENNESVFFDQVGIVRDVLLSHLLQLVALIAVEPPVRVTGPNSADFFRQEKIKVLRCIEPLDAKNVVLGQYAGYAKLANVAKGSSTPTFASCVCYVKNPRWEGVPFILRGGRAMNESKEEIRIQFKAPKGSNAMFATYGMPSANELVFQMLPERRVYMSMNTKRPGLSSRTASMELDLTCQQPEGAITQAVEDSYANLLLDVLNGKRAAFIGDEEALASWRVFAPFLEKSKRMRPSKYAFGSAGPADSERKMMKRLGIDGAVVDK